MFVQVSGKMQRSNNPNAWGAAEHGYILLLLMLWITLMVIAATAAVPSITFQIRRDREEELIHRGVQYSRAIRRYVKKLGRYPTRIEDLENTNNLRFLRKRYKDPVTGREFRLLHLGEVQVSFGPGIAGASRAAGPVQGVPTLGGALLNSGGAKPSPTPKASSSDDSQKEVDPLDTEAGEKASPMPADNEDSKDSLPGIADDWSKQVAGGGPIVGVVSTSSQKSIREFNHKNRYNQWQFIYDPASDRGGLLSTPNQPPLKGGQAVTPAEANNQTGSALRKGILLRPINHRSS